MSQNSSLNLFFNIDNRNTFSLSSKSAYYNNFWRIMWHWSLE